MNKNKQNLNSKDKSEILIVSNFRSLKICNIYFNIILALSGVYYMITAKDLAPFYILFTLNSGIIILSEIHRKSKKYTVVINRKIIEKYKFEKAVYKSHSTMFILTLLLLILWQMLNSIYFRFPIEIAIIGILIRIVAIIYYTNKISKEIKN